MRRSNQQKLSDLWNIPPKRANVDEQCANSSHPPVPPLPSTTAQEVCGSATSITTRNIGPDDVIHANSNSQEVYPLLSAEPTLGSGDYQPHDPKTSDIGQQVTGRPTLSTKPPEADAVSEFDIGLYMNSSKGLSYDIKCRLLTNPYQPPDNYDFTKDSFEKDRRFRPIWLVNYAPWLAYSCVEKGALCVYCTVFRQSVQSGFQGALVSSTLRKYKNFNECATAHMRSSGHKNAQIHAEHFLAVKRNPEKNVIHQLDRALMHTVEENRQKLQPILSTIIFCGTHDIALRGKNTDTGNVHDLYHFRIEAGDVVLANHLKTASRNAQYTSNRTQNDLITTCGNVIQNEIVKAANASTGFSILADETADISGKKQLSIGIRYVEINGEIYKIYEEFIGFVKLESMTAESIASAILKKCEKSGLEMSKLLGQGYDGCSAMAGKEGGVQAIIRQKHPRAAFVHCSAHRLNLVINDLNAVPQVRNAVGTIKAIIKFFRESVKQKSLIPNIPLLCETRWTSKYQSFREFSDHFKSIYLQLENIATTASRPTAQTSHQLQSSCNNGAFLVCLKTISMYSALLEPVAQALQAVQLDLLQVQQHVSKLLTIFQSHRNNAEKSFRDDVYAHVVQTALALNVDLVAPRICARSHHRSNPPSSSVEDYFCKAIYIPYMDSLITSLECRFSASHTPQFNLFMFHPLQLLRLDRAEYKENVSCIQETYNIDNLQCESVAWYDLWNGSQPPHSELTTLQLVDLLPSTKFFPAIRQAILIALTLPASTCNVERSFSTLRRVKTWLRSTMSNDRLSGLCMLSVHRERAKKAQFIQDVMQEFGRDSRRLQFLFKE